MRSGDVSGYPICGVQIKLDLSIPGVYIVDSMNSWSNAGIYQYQGMVASSRGSVALLICTLSRSRNP